jgi:hypothetical protein
MLLKGWSMLLNAAECCSRAGQCCSMLLHAAQGLVTKLCVLMMTPAVQLIGCTCFWLLPPQKAKYAVW